MLFLRTGHQNQTLPRNQEKCPAKYSASLTKAVFEVNAYKKQPMISLWFLFWFTELENQRTLEFEKTWEVVWSNSGHSEDVTAITESRHRRWLFPKRDTHWLLGRYSKVQCKGCPWLAFLMILAPTWGVKIPWGGRGRESREREKGEKEDGL